ncbi:DUF1045 domain-containing protein [Devosia rhodophyticola]|uniref:DUF1045 domain-containing protein n=1 Tax=Devosia rhodophyticola TaxID=3026423 RepID=A0ABY7Z0A2_9HYPH|nr:DUF1045 domain-containing protein [Devosia rhodophyticola]WDR07016.1 DUF1045 domain-containing protein [Devosia rhodophyticola]
MPERFAIYYAPATTHPLWDRAASWLGRDPANKERHDGPVAGIDRNRLLNLTQSASRYGFHATIKAPMALASGATRADLQAALERFAKTYAPVDLGRLQIGDLSGFLALVPTDPDEAIKDFAATVVEQFEIFRAPLTNKVRAARLADGLTPRQEELLDAYGYPYAFEEFQFHMTLTDRLAPAERADIAAAANTWFAPELEAPLQLDRLALYHEADSGSMFTRIADFPLQGAN